MRVLFTVESYYPLKNGVQEITQRYAEEIARRGHDVTVLTSSVEGAASEESHNGVKICRVNIHTKKSIYTGDINGYKALVKKMSENQDVMINICTQTATTDCLLPVLGEIKCKKVLYLHGMAHFNFPNIERVDLHDILSWMLNITRWKLFYIYHKRHFRQYDAIIHLHKLDKSYLLCEKLGLKNYVLENCTFDSMTCGALDASNAPYLMIGNYIHDKNQELALRAYYRSKSSRPLFFVGSKETKYLARLRELNKKLHLEDPSKMVEFVVGESHQRTMDRLRDSYALVHSSKSEKYPVVICEAQKAGKPFICTDTGVCKHLPGGIAVVDEQSFISAIDKLEHDMRAYEELSHASKAYSMANQDFYVNCEKLIGILERDI